MNDALSVLMIGTIVGFGLSLFVMMIGTVISRSLAILDM